MCVCVVEICVRKTSLAERNKKLTVPTTRLTPDGRLDCRRSHPTRGPLSPNHRRHIILTIIIILCSSAERVL